MIDELPTTVSRNYLQREASRVAYENNNVFFIRNISLFATELKVPSYFLFRHANSSVFQPNTLLEVAG